MGLGLAGLTVVIPSRDRRPAVERQVRIWRDSPARVLLLDNGVDGLPSRVRREMPSNILYEHRPGQFLDQLESVSQRIETPYAVYCDDDNLFLPAGLGACLEVLEADASLAFSWGRTAKFLTFVGKVYVAESYQRHTTAFAGERDGLIRVKGHFDAYEPSAWYAVHRAESFRSLNAAAVQLLRGCSSRFASEIGVEAATFFRGRGRQVPCLTLLRSLENPPLDLGTRARSLGFSDWMNGPEYAGEVQDFDRVMRQLCENVPGGQGDAEGLLAILRAGPGSPSVASGRVSVNEAAQSLPHWLVGNVAVRCSLTAGSRVRGSVSWWWSTIAGAEAACVLARVQGRPERVVRAKAWAPDTVVDWQAIEELPW